MNGGIIKNIGEVEISSTGTKKIKFSVENLKDGIKEYIVRQNKINAFDLIRKFERGDFKAGMYIEFSYFKDINKPLPNVWRIYNVSHNIPKNPRFN